MHKYGFNINNEQRLCGIKPNQTKPIQNYSNWIASFIFDVKSKIC